jgi:hypothetical protein
MRDRVLPDVKEKVTQQAVCEEKKRQILQVVRQDLTAAVRHLLQKMRDKSRHNFTIITGFLKYKSHVSVNACVCQI